MNVGLVVPGFSADAADWCIPALRHLARSLARTDDLRVMALRYPYRPSRYPIDGADVIALGGADRRGVATPGFWRSTLDLLRAEHRRRAFDVLHAFWGTESGMLAAVAGRWLRIPTLVSLAGGELVALRDIQYGDQRSAWEQTKVRVSLRLADAVSAGSRLLLATAAGHVAARKLHRAPLGVDLALFRSEPARASDDPKTIVHVGALNPVKDQAALLRAFARLRKAGACATLDLVGEGPLRPELERLAAALGVADGVRFRGEVDHAALPSVYRTASVFVLSSRHEAQGMVALEAAACGVPVVGTRVGVIPELTSAAVAIGADQALADAMAAALERASGDDARERVVDDFELHACAARFRALYRELGD